MKFHPFILLQTIAVLLTASPAPLAHNAVIGTPQIAYGDDAPLDPADVQDFAAHDVNRIQGNIARCLARKAPWLDILEGGSIKSGVSQVQRAVVQERAVLNESLVRPNFTPDIDIAGETGMASQVGSTEYSYFLGTIRGMGPLVNVKQMRDAFETSYSTSEEAIKKQIVQLMNADVRGTLVDRSGCKIVFKSNTTFNDMFTGDAQAIDTPFETKLGLPDSPLTFKLLEFTSIFLRENLLVEGFEGTQTEPLLKFIGSQEIISRLRDEANVSTIHQYLEAGHYQMGPDALTKYTWEGPYRGYAFGIDPQPLRFSSIDTDGQPLYIEPEIAVKTSNGVAARINPAWAKALYEVGVVVGANSFRRLSPEQYNGEGTYKFPAQISMGELQFRVIEDNSKNVWRDYGRHFYQIQRAYRAERPHAICPIIYKRAQVDFGASPVGNVVSDYSSADSL